MPPDIHRFTPIQGLTPNWKLKVSEEPDLEMNLKFIEGKGFLRRAHNLKLQF